MCVCVIGLLNDDDGSILLLNNRLMMINLMFRPLTIDDDGDTLGITVFAT